VHNIHDGFHDEVQKIKLWEAYLNYASGNLNLKLGKQVIRWGKGDQINPTDNFTPEDLTEYVNLRRAERKIPIWMTKVNYSLYPYRLEAIWIPIFVPSLVPYSLSDWESYYHHYYRSSVLFNLERPERPGQYFNSPVAALKLIKNTSNYDISLSYAYHYDEFPTFHVSSPLRRIGIFDGYDVYQRYHRQHTIGSDFETLIGKIGLWSEFAYTFGDYFVSYAAKHSDAAVKKDVLNGVMGADYTFKNDIYVNAQYIMQYIPGRESQMASRRYEDHILCRVSRQFFNDNLLLQASTRIFFIDTDYYYNLKCEYKVTDWLKLTLGYDYYFGEKVGTLGQYDDNDQFYAKVKISF